MSFTHRYRISGLQVHSEIELPELLALESGSGPADVQIRVGKVPTRLEDAVQSMPEAQVTPEAVLLTIPGVCRYLVNQDGIQVEPIAGSSDEDLRLFLLGSAMGALYFLRGDFPLHASVVVINETAVAFAGDSGMGKSTMAAYMSGRGHELLCDDVCVVRFLGDRAIAYPAYPRLKLWHDALPEFGLDASGLVPDHSRTRKYHLQARERFRADPAPLDHVFFLRFTDSSKPAATRPIKPAHTVPLLRDNTYRFQFISGLGLTQRHFLQCTRLARFIHAHSLDRPREHAMLERCAQLVEAQTR